MKPPVAYHVDSAIACGVAVVLLMLFFVALWMGQP